MTRPIIEVKNVSKRYRLGQFNAHTLREEVERLFQRRRSNGKTSGTPNDLELWALKDVSFSVMPGEVFGIIGRNGSGKSTLLKILSRITEPTSGEIRVRGRVASLLEVGTGFHPELTGRENIYLNGAILGMSGVEVKAKFDEIVAFAEIEKFLDTPVKRYSSGMYVRLAFAVAAHLEPEILVVDEVLAVGDVPFQRKCLGKMNDVVAKGGRTVLLVSHQMGFVRALCARCLLLSEGSITLEGSAVDVTQHYLEFDSLKKNVSGFTIERDPEIPLQVIGGTISDFNGRSRSSFDVFERIVLNIKYVVHKPIYGGMIGFEVKRNGDTVFLTFDTDSDDTALLPRERGDYEARVELPCPLLKPGYYSISVGTGIPNSVALQTLDSILGVEVRLLSRSPSTVSFAEKRPGLIAVPLRWESKRVESVG